MSLTKKHYEAIAEIIGQHWHRPPKEEAFIDTGLLNELECYFIEDNPNFSVYEFDQRAIEAMNRYNPIES